MAKKRPLPVLPGLVDGDDPLVLEVAPPARPGKGRTSLQTCSKTASFRPGGFPPLGRVEDLKRKTSRHGCPSSASWLPRHPAPPDRERVSDSRRSTPGSSLPPVPIEKGVRGPPSQGRGRDVVIGGRTRPTRLERGYSGGAQAVDFPGCRTWGAVPPKNAPTSGLRPERTSRPDGLPQRPPSPRPGATQAQSPGCSRNYVLLQVHLTAPSRPSLPATPLKNSGAAGFLPSPRL